jgi:hypothetical protein
MKWLSSWHYRSELRLKENIISAGKILQEKQSFDLIA